MTLHVDAKLHAGTSLDLKAFLENRSQPLVLAHAIELAGEKPVIVDSQLSLPPDVGVVLKPEELPAPYYLSALLKVSHVGTEPAVGLRCSGDAQARVTLRPGTKPEAGKLHQLSAEQIFITFDDALFPSGCDLLADLQGGSGTSARPLGRVKLFPKIDTFTFDGVSLDATLTGSDLETIGKAGWDPENGVSISDLPTTVAGEPRKQQLRVSLPARPDTAPPLYIWLRGEDAGRATFVTIPQLARK